MRRDNFWLDGKDAAEFGIVLQKEIEFEGAEPVVESMKIAGTDREILYYDGSYKNVHGMASCYYMGGNAADAVTAISEWLMGTPGYRRLEVLHEPNFYRLARVQHGVKMDHRINMLNAFVIDFDCDPYKYFKSGEVAVSMSAAGTLSSPTSFSALPVITVSGSGAGTITVNGNTLSLTNCNGTVLDSRERSATRGGVKVNSEISGTYPVFCRSNSISFTGGVTGLSIIPRWRCL